MSIATIAIDLAKTMFELAAADGHILFREDGTPISDLNHPYDRWRWTLPMMRKARYREPYNARHSFVSCNLMLGENLLWVAKQNGHSVQTMLGVYGIWIEGSQQADLEAIRRAMEVSPRRGALTSLLRDPSVPASPQNLAVVWQ
ncbi:hypothetical protein [Steroidobacter cummioxidans]|uniref:hypothetical protein n=1 Tax=Steroidobacter cummioxidans TaxID=1803913 RepID=UPI000E313E49|nr:hypothetical protein [Steroidobacter cummioxidans]